MSAGGAGWLPSRRQCLALLALAGLSACQAAPVAPLGAADAADVARVETYLNGLHTLTGRVLQIWPSGAASEGTVWLQRPGRLRVQYDPPYPALLVAANGLVVFQDLAQHSTSSLPLANTPLGILLADPIQFSGDVAVTAVQRGVGELRVTMVQRRRPGAGSLTVILADAPLRLVGINLIDARDQETRMRLANPRSGEPLDPGLFQVAAPVQPKYVN